MLVRALLRALSVTGSNTPYNTLTLRVFYPAENALDDTTRDTGVLPVAREGAPYPVVIFFPGVNCDSYQYHWLANAICEAGYVVALPSWIAQQLSGRTSYTPGIDLFALKPEVYGSRPTSLTLQPILEALDKLNREGVLWGALDLNRVVLGGHSAGGTMALMNASRRFVEGIVGCFSLMANILATSALGGWERGQIPPLPTDVPALLVVGGADQISDHHNTQFGGKRDDMQHGWLLPHPLSVTIDIPDATHYSVCYPLDETIGRTFLEAQPQDTTFVRNILKGEVVRFLEGVTKAALTPTPAPKGKGL